jgi:hypothetical protein
MGAIKKNQGGADMGFLFRTGFAFAAAFYFLQMSTDVTPQMTQMNNAIGALLSVDVTEISATTCARRFVGRPGHRTIELACV